MTTKNSPPKKIRREANQIANVLIDAALGKFATPELRSRYEAAKVKGTFTVAIAMDDKFIQLEIDMTQLGTMDRAGLAEYIFNQMAERTHKVH